MGARNSSAFGISMEEPKTLKGDGNEKEEEGNTRVRPAAPHIPRPNMNLTRIFLDDPIWLVLPSFFFRLLFSIDH